MPKNSLNLAQVWRFLVSAFQILHSHQKIEFFKIFFISDISWFLVSRVQDHPDRHRPIFFFDWAWKKHSFRTLKTFLTCPKFTFSDFLWYFLISKLFKKKIAFWKTAIERFTADLTLSLNEKCQSPCHHDRPRPVWREFISFKATVKKNLGGLLGSITFSAYDVVVSTLRLIILSHEKHKTKLTHVEQLLMKLTPNRVQ